MAIEYDSKDLRQHLAAAARDDLVLPNFQRDFVWTPAQQRELLASFLLGLPIGTFLLLKAQPGDFSAKRLCDRHAGEFEGGGTYLLDGQQRLSTLRSIFDDLYDSPEAWEENHARIYRGLQRRWFIRLDTDHPLDLFGIGLLRPGNLTAYEPGEVVDDVFVDRAIYKKDVSAWYHPGFSPKTPGGENVSDQERRVEIAHAAAAEGLVPLFDIYRHPDRGLHYFALRRIARDRADILRSRVEAGVLSLEEVLGDLEPRLHSRTPDDIARLWADLEARWVKETSDAVSGALSQPIPDISLPASELKRAVVIFEETNKTGTRLDLFDLIVARAARIGGDTKSLSDILTENIAGQVFDDPAHPVWTHSHDPPDAWWAADMNILADGDDRLTKTFKKAYLNTLSLISNCGATVTSAQTSHIKRNAILELSQHSIHEHTQTTMRALVRSLAFLQARAGIVSLSDLPYELMILPIAICLRHDEVWGSTAKLDLIEYWYWSALFGGRYRSAQTEHAVEDVRLLHSWLSEDATNPFGSWEKRVLAEEGYSAKKVLLLQDERYSPSSAIASALHQYVLSREPEDFLLCTRLTAWRAAANSEHTFKTRHDDKDVDTSFEFESHHIIPLYEASTIHESAQKLRKAKNHILNSPLNRTFITRYSNRVIGGRSPQAYFELVADLAQWGHCIPTPVEQFFQQPNTAGNRSRAAYNEFLSQRYEQVRRDLGQELASLGRERPRPTETP